MGLLQFVAVSMYFRHIIQHHFKNTNKYNKNTNKYISPTHTTQFSQHFCLMPLLPAEPHLLQGLAGQVSLRHVEAVALRREVPHLAVGGPVVQRHRGQVVEGFVQVVGHIGYKQTRERDYFPIPST